MCFTVEWIDKNNQKLCIQSYLKLQFFSEFERTSLFRLVHYVKENEWMNECIQKLNQEEEVKVAMNYFVSADRRENPKIYSLKLWRKKSHLSITGNKRMEIIWQ